MAGRRARLGPVPRVCGREEGRGARRPAFHRGEAPQPLWRSGSGSGPKLGLRPAPPPPLHVATGEEGGAAQDVGGVVQRRVRAARRGEWARAARRGGGGWSAPWSRRAPPPSPSRSGPGRRHRRRRGGVVVEGPRAWFVVTVDALRVARVPDVSVKAVSATAPWVPRLPSPKRSRPRDPPSLQRRVPRTSNRRRGPLSRSGAARSTTPGPGTA